MMKRLAALMLSVIVGLPVLAADAPVVLVAGATGRTGQEVVKQLLAEKFQVRALVRDEAKARAQFGDKVQYVVGDVREAATLQGAAKGATYVVSALGSNSRKDPTNKPERVDYEGVKNLVDAAKSAGVQQFVLVSSMGVTQPDHMLNKMLDNILQWKLKGEDHLRASGVPYTIVRPGGLTETPGGKQGIKVEQGDRPADGKSAPGMIPRADVASVIVRSLGTADARGKTFEIVTDPATTSVEWRSFFKNLKADPAR